MTDLTRLNQFLANHPNYHYRLEANTFVLEPQKIMYMDTPKAAGTSIKTALCQLDENYVLPDDSNSPETVAEMFIHDRGLNPLKPVTSYPEEVRQDILFSDQWKRFCVLRNPFDRIFSAWFSKVLLRQPGFIDKLPGYSLPDKIEDESAIYDAFEAFLVYLSQKGCDSDAHWDLQTRLLFHNEIAWHAMLRFESLREDLSGMDSFFGGVQLELDQLNVSGLTPDWSKVSDTALQLIRQIYSEDFEAYDFPRSPAEAVNPTEPLLVTYVNAVIARNLRLGQLFTRITKFEQQAHHQQDAITRLKSESEGLSRELTETRKNLEDTGRSLENVTRNLELTKTKLDETTRTLNDTTQELGDVLSSNSWKLTAPLRALRNVFRSGQKQA